MSEISQLIQEIAGNRNQDTVQLLICVVESVDIENRICNVTTVSGDTTLSFEAQLISGVADGLLLIPEVESTVYVQMSKYTLPFVALYSDVTAMVIMGGEHGGLVKVIELVQKINNLENKVNEIITKFNALTLPVSGATAGPTTNPIVGSLTPTVRNDIENTDITHGSST